MSAKIRPLEPLPIGEVAAIEVDRSLRMDQRELQRLPAFDRLKSDLGRFVEAVSGFVRARL